MTQTPVVVVMAGGSGTRFWPLSTPARPKQFVALGGERTLLQETVDRLEGFTPPERILVLTGEPFVDLVREQLPDLPPGNVVGEPVARDTAGAVALAGHLVRERFPGAAMVLLPADHRISPVEELHRALGSAAAGCLEARTVYTFGIPPDHPATGYGYLEVGDVLETRDGVEHLALARFVEKPDREAAEAFLEGGRHLWNSGMFVWPVDLLWEALERHLPEHARLLGGLELHGGVPDPGRLKAALVPLEKVSIDVAVMEKLRDIRCVRAPFSWSDVGGWVALADELPEDASGNRVRADLHAREAGDNLVYCEDPSEVVSLLGVEGLVVVRSGNRTLVARREALGHLKALVKDELS